MCLCRQVVPNLFWKPRFADKDLDRSGAPGNLARPYVGTPKWPSLLRETTEIDQWYTTCEMMVMSIQVLILSRKFMQNIRRLVGTKAVSSSTSFLSPSWSTSSALSRTPRTQILLHYGEIPQTVHHQHPKPDQNHTTVAQAPPQHTKDQCNHARDQRDNAEWPAPQAPRNLSCMNDESLRGAPKEAGENAIPWSE